MIHTAETRRRLSEMRKGEANPFFGKKHSAETRQELAGLLRSYAKDRTYSILDPSIRMPSGTALAYLAGIVDGEGSIRFRAGRPFVAVYNSSVELKEWIEANTGVKAAWTDNRGRVPGWQWVLNSAMNVYVFCQLAMPFLIVKRDDAKAALSHIEAKYHGRIRWER